MKKYKDVEVGDKLGNLIVLKNEIRKNHKYCLCKCVCGNIKLIREDALKNGSRKDCGCSSRAKSSIRMKQLGSQISANKFVECGDVIKCYTSKNEVFYISKESEWVLKDYCWHTNQDKYLISISRASKKGVSLHRILMKTELDKLENKGKVVDHIDGNPLNNCLDNLRLVTNAQNQWNKKRTENYGIFIDKRKNVNPYIVQLRYKGKMIELGANATLEQAKLVRDNWENKHERINYFRKKLC